MHRQTVLAQQKKELGALAAAELCHRAGLPAAKGVVCQVLVVPGEVIILAQGSRYTFGGTELHGIQVRRIPAVRPFGAPWGQRPGREDGGLLVGDGRIRSRQDTYSLVFEYRSQRGELATVELEAGSSALECTRLAREIAAQINWTQVKAMEG